MPEDVEFVELIEVDPRAFGGSGGSTPPPPPSARGQRERRPPDPVRRGARVGILLCAIAVVALGLSLIVTKPWVPDLQLALPDPRALDSELSERLIIDPAPADLRTASLPDGTGETFEQWAGDSVGYFFVEPDATFDPSESDGSWFGFFAKRADDPRTPIVAGLTKINGAPAEVSDESNGEFVDLYWGPIDGWMIRGVAAHSSIEEATAIAEQLHVVEGRVVVDDRRVLGDMVPAAPFGDYVSLNALYRYAYDFGQSLDGLVGLYYGYSGESVVSVPGNESALEMVPFLLSNEHRVGTVHGLPAVGFSKGAGPFGSIDRSTVIWWEGGRLILVAGGDDLDATFRLAEKVRTATDDEWAKVTALVDAVDTGVRT
ncbi:MAG: hypothetical protein ACOYMR_16845 [Ilumatobacteraceae bacterium]